MRFKSFIRSIASLSLSSLVLLAALACPALVQSDEAAPDIKTAFSKLSVTPKSLSYNVNINKGVFSETKHFHITNEGTVPLKVVVNTPSNPAYVVRSGGGTTTIPGKVKGSKAEHLSTVDVEFIPNGSVKSENGTIGVISDATSGKKIAIVALNGRTKKGGRNPTVTATATATKIATATRTATPTATPTVPATATATKTPTATATATRTATASATRTASATMTPTVVATATATATTTPTATATSTRTTTATVTTTMTATASPTATAKSAGVTPTGSNAGGQFGAWSPASVSLYSGTTNGNLVMVMLCVSGTVTAFTPPAGYSQLGSIEATSTGEYCGLFYHVWSSGDPTVVSFADNYAASTERNYVTVTYSGENTTRPFDPNATPSCPGSLSSSSLTLSALSPSGSGDLLASFWAEANASGGSPTATYTSPLTQMTSYQLATSWNKNYVANGALSASGSTGNKAATFSLPPSGGVGFIIAIQPATGATPTPTATTTGATATPTATAPGATPTVTATATTVPPTATATGGTPAPTATAKSTAKPTATPTPGALDQYGGTTSVQCPNGPGPHFYTEKIGNRWWFCDPAGNGFFEKSISDVNFNVNTGQDTFAATKYAGGMTTIWQYNWSLEQLNRMQSWGMSAVDADQYYRLTPFYTDSAWPTSDHTIPVHMPQNYQMNTSLYAMENVNGCSVSSALKDLINGVGATYTGWKYDYGDYFDPHFSTCLGNMLAGSSSPSVHGMATGIHNDYLLSITIDEGDETGGLLGSGPDFPEIGTGASIGGQPGWVTLATAPTQRGTTSSSVKNWLGGSTYSDQTVYTKLAFANFLANKYICTGSGTPIAACTGNHTGTGSIDPNSASYFGSTNLSSGISALNTAWSSYYSTWVSDTANCGTNLATCLSGGTLSDWGTGDGLLEENGACPSKGAHTCWMGSATTLSGETTAMQADLSAFYSLYLDQYLSVEQSQWHNPTYGAPGILLEMGLGGWSTPPRKEALTEGSKYLGILGLAPIPSSPWACASIGGCTDYQARINFVAQYGGGVPWTEWEGIDANPDSAESAYPSSINSPYTTQQQRGAGFASMVSGLVSAQDTATGTFHVVGYTWWDMFDMNSQKLNWGFITPVLDNPYDGCSATNAGCGNDAWGFPTGGEAANYGDFIDDVTAANNSVYSLIAP